MTVHLHTLSGCAPAPLANYLKALGVLRLVGQQADPHARGWWDGERFRLLTTLGREELEGFFLEKYEPTPIFNPWGGRSGFYPDSSEKKSRNALVAIEVSTSSRLGQFRGAIAVSRTVIQEHGGGKPSSKEEKARMQAGLRKRLRGAGLEWLDTVVADLGESFGSPALIGTGGNEGSGSYTVAFMAAVVECILNRNWNDAIKTSLWESGADRHAWEGGFKPLPTAATPKPKKESVEGPFRQFMPTGSGSPWDLLLAFEGLMAIQSGVRRRSVAGRADARPDRFSSSPFYFAPLAVGSSSNTRRDEIEVQQNREMEGRGEQWFPLWENPSTFVELQALFREGKCSSGRNTARDPLNSARAICGLGISRGITEFIRYGYLQRDNLTSHLAVPLGRVKPPKGNHTRLIDDIDGWLQRVHRAARNKNAPARLAQAERRLADAVFAALTHDHTADRWQAILLAAVEVEAIQASGSGIDAGPIPPLNPEWVAAVSDTESGAEVRLALALGGARAPHAKGQPRDPVRHHWLPLKPGARNFNTSDKRLANDPRVVMTGRDPVRDLIAVAERRLVEAGQKGARRSRLVAATGCGARLADLAAFLSGSLDDAKLFGLARAFMAIDWKAWRHEHAPKASPSRETPDETWLALRLTFLPWDSIPPGTRVYAEPRVVRLLATGDATRAIEIARQRLRSAGIRPPFQFGTTDPATAHRWAAALAFPISTQTAEAIAETLDPRRQGVPRA